MTDLYSREQRLRKQAELQSHYNNLAGLRGRESTFMDSSATIPEMLTHQINEFRHTIAAVENELLTVGDDTVKSPAHQFYWEAFEAELAEDYDKAIKLYKNAARQSHPDANAAINAVRYRVKTGKQKYTTNQMWIAAPASRSRRQLWVAAALILTLIVIFIIVSQNSASLPQASVSSSVTTTVTTISLKEIPLIVINTATSLPTSTPTEIPATIPPPTPEPTATDETPTETPSPQPTLINAPKIIGPKNGLVWRDGSIVFEFEKVDLAHDELYCLSTLRGFDINNAENWSFPPIGRKEPSIPIESSVFKIAKMQGIQCVVWFANIGKETCDNIISKNSLEYIIGLPRPCDFR